MHLDNLNSDEDMRSHATFVPTRGNVEYREGTSGQTGLPDHEADIVTCSQSLHWMDSRPTFREVARILRPGGVFAAFDYDWPPTTGVWQADAAYVECMKTINELEMSTSPESRVKSFPKDQHIDRMRESLCFEFAKEIVVHHVTKGNADTFIGLLLTQGGVQTLLKAGRSPEHLAITRFAERAREFLGDEKRDWYWSSRVRIGIA